MKFLHLAIVFCVFSQLPSLPTCCDLEGQCTCSNSGNPIREVLCLSIVSPKVPIISNESNVHVFRFSIINSPELFYLNTSSLGTMIVSSLAIKKTHLMDVDENAFAGSEDTLTTLDLSFNELDHFPLGPLLQRLSALQWLSLKGNKIDDLQIEADGQQQDSDTNSPEAEWKLRGLIDGNSTHLNNNKLGLRNLILSNNLLTIIAGSLFVPLNSLQSLDLDNNRISKIENKPFPVSLSSLSLANNLLEQIPVESLQALGRLKWFTMRGNLIRNLPSFWPFSVNSIDILDLSHNLLSTLDASFFQPLRHAFRHRKRGSLRHSAFARAREDYANDGADSVSKESLQLSDHQIAIKDLLLDFNFIQSIEPNVFSNVSVDRLSLGNNMITQLPAKLFENNKLSANLRVLDISYNLLENFPKAFKSLENLSNLILKGNRLNSLDHDCFEKAKTELQMLDLSENRFFKVPVEALSPTESLIKLNLAGNYIHQLSSKDFGKWSSKLLSLSLSKNGLKFVKSDAFSNLSSLKELKLSHNNLMFVGINFLEPLKSTLVMLDLSFSVKSYNFKLQFHDPNSNGDFRENGLEQSADLLVSREFEKLELLELDHNKFESLSSDFLSRASSLIHLDLDGNQLESLPQLRGSEKAGKRLRSIILANNKLLSLNSSTFVDLPSINSIDLRGNYLHAINSATFNNLSSLSTVILTHNQLEFIASGAFIDCPQLSNIFLQENRLKTISLDSFLIAGRLSSELPTRTSIGPTNGPETGEDQSMPETREKSRDRNAYQVGIAVNLNASRNQISEVNLGENGLQPGESSSSFNDSGKLNVKSLDLSYNLLKELSPLVGRALGSSLIALHLDHNLFQKMPIAFLENCPKLRILTINNNNLDKGSMTNSSNELWCASLISLDISRNNVSDLEAIAMPFNEMSSLVSLHLGHNNLRQLNCGVFSGTSIARLSIPGNKLGSKEHDHASNCSSPCFGISMSLMHLDLSFNEFAHFPGQISNCPLLMSLNLSGNRIHHLIDYSLSSYPHLREISLDHNSLKSIGLRAFDRVHQLAKLSLNNCSLQDLPLVDGPKLMHLEMSMNLVVNFSASNLFRSKTLRSLDLSWCNLTEVPRQLGQLFGHLNSLNIANNPIFHLDSSSLALGRLHSLDMRSLELKYIDHRVFNNLRHLTELRTSTYPRLRAFRLAELLAKSNSLRTVTIEVEEASLTHQIQWAFGVKLRELIITGKRLRRVIPDAFLGLQHKPELTLRIVHTNLTNLPAGLLRYITDIRFMTVDLRKNSLNTLMPQVFYPWLESDSKEGQEARSTVVSTHLSGGIFVDDNPLECDCNLLWFASWLQRWTKENRRLNLLNYPAIINADSRLRSAKCRYHSSRSSFFKALITAGNSSALATSGGHYISIIDLSSNNIGCSSSVSASNSTHFSFSLLYITILILTKQSIAKII